MSNQIKKILITGFEPFGGESTNPSFDAVSLMPSTVLGGQIIKLQLPTVYIKSGEVLRSAIIEHKPDAVICVGQAGGRSTISLERVAINLAEANLADNDGNILSDATICKDGKNAYFSTLPVKAIVQAINENGIPASLSYSAGSFVCNSTMYQLLHMAENEFPEVKGGFIHVPFSPAQAVHHNGAACMALDMIAKALTIAATAIASGSAECSAPMGTTM